MARRFADSELVNDWWPVVVLPPILLADAALSTDPAVKPITVVSVLATIVACLPLVLRRHLGFGVLCYRSPRGSRWRSGS